MKTKLFEGRLAQDYDRNMPVLFPGYHTMQERTSDILKRILLNKPLPEVLIAGCGTGTEMQYFLKSNPSWRLTGVDPSPQMLAKATEKFAASPDIKLVNGLVTDLPEAARFDAATLHLVLHFLPDDGDKLNLLTQIFARLCKGAYFILVDIFGTGPSFSYNMQQLEHTLLQKNISVEVAHKMMANIKNDLHVCSEERQVELLKAAGFIDVCRFYQDYIYGGWAAKKSD